MEYKNVLIPLLKAHGLPPQGNTILFIWSDVNHFNEWSSNDENKIKNIRIITVPSHMLPNNTVHNKEEIVVAGIAFGVEPDYSDIQLMYQLELGV